LRLDVPHNIERTIEMLTAKETAIHLENLRHSHEITHHLRRLLSTQGKGRIVIFRERSKHVVSGWCATFYNVFDMPNDTLPLPWASIASPEIVAADLAKRFPHSDITVHV
jgi:hypothetical protein